MTKWNLQAQRWPALHGSRGWTLCPVDHCREQDDLDGSLVKANRLLLLDARKDIDLNLR